MVSKRTSASGLGIIGVLLAIVIGLSLTSTVATSTSSASTALAPFSGAQSLVIIVPLIFVAIILIGAYKHAHAVSLEMRTTGSPFKLIVVLTRKAMVFIVAYAKNVFVFSTATEINTQ